MRKNTIILSNGKEISFVGDYVGQAHPDTPEKVTDNWHYYKGEDGKIYHIRKEHLVACIEEKE